MSPTAATAHRGQAHVTIFHATHFDGGRALNGGQDFARRAALLRRLRAALPEPRNALVVGNGDDIDPGMGRGSVVDSHFTVEHGPDTRGMYAFDAFKVIGLGNRRLIDGACELAKFKGYGDCRVQH